MAKESHQIVAARPEPGTQGRTRRIVHGLLLFVAFAIVVDAIVGERGLLAMREARRDSQALQERITERREENAALAERARRLKEDDRAIEELARRELGLIRSGEKVFIIRDLQ